MKEKENLEFENSLFEQAISNLNLNPENLLSEADFEVVFKEMERLRAGV